MTCSNENGRIEINCTAGRLKGTLPFARLGSGASLLAGQAFAGPIGGAISGASVIRGAY